MKQGLDWKYSLGSVAKFTLPTIILQLFVVCYQAVDGYFVANYASTDGLAAINLVFPVINVLLAISLMLSTGGSAMVGKCLGASKTRGQDSCSQLYR